MAFYLMDPSDHMGRGFDYTDWLDGQTIGSSAWEISPEEDGGLAAEEPVNTGTITSAILTGGVEGRIYRVANHIVSSGNEEETRTFRVLVRKS
jgi:hypothetical protein